MTRKLRVGFLLLALVASLVALASAVFVGEAADKPTEVQKLIREIEAAYVAKDIERAEFLVGLLQAALRSEAAQLKAIGGKPGTQGLTLNPGPFDLVSSEGIEIRVSIPWHTAYLMKSSTYDWPQGDTFGQIKISILGAAAFDNKIFKVGDTTLYATFRSSDSSVVEVDEKGYLRPQRAGVAAITVAVGDASVTALIKVIELPVSDNMRPTEVITAMGFPDRTEGWLWYWNKYPDMCLEVSEFGFVGIRTKWSGTLK